MPAKIVTPIKEEFLSSEDRINVSLIKRIIRIKNIRQYDFFEIYLWNNYAKSYLQYVILSNKKLYTVYSDSYDFEATGDIFSVLKSAAKYVESHQSLYGLTIRHQPSGLRLLSVFR